MLLLTLLCFCAAHDAEEGPHACLQVRTLHSSDCQRKLKHKPPPTLAAERKPASIGPLNIRVSACSRRLKNFS